MAKNLKFKNMNFENLTYHYKTRMAARHSQKTKDVIYPIIKKWLAPHFGKQNVGAITVKDVNRLLIKLRKNHLSENRIYNIFTTLKAIFNKAVEWGYKRINPCDAASNSPILHKGQAHIPTSAETTNLLKTVFSKKNNSSESQNAIILFLIISTGMRFSEISNLTWDNIDLINKVVSYDKQNFSSITHFEFKITPLMYKFLLFMKHRQKSLFKTLGVVNRCNFVFTENFNGGNFNPNVIKIKYTSLYHWTKEKFAIAGIKTSTMESLRSIDRDKVTIKSLPLPI